MADDVKRVETDQVREKLIELIGKMLSFGHGTLYTMADYLIANGVTVQKWILVAERLPDKQHDWVLAACKLVPEGFYGVPHIAELRNGKWWADSGDFPLDEIGVEVTHWMPLPEPPKEGCKDG